VTIDNNTFQKVRRKDFEMENWRVKQVMSGGWHGGRGELVRKGCRRVNMMEIYTHI
jgi:hypothetical protein